MVDSNSPERTNVQEAMFEIIARKERVDGAREVLGNVAQTLIENGMDALDVATALEDVAVSLKHYS